MAYCGHSRGMCGRRADCADTHCPGRWDAVDLDALLAAGQRSIYVNDGGHRVSGSDSLRLRIERAAEPEPTSRWPDAITGAVIVLACILAAACMGVQIHF